MPTSTYFPTLHGGTTGEQGLIQDLVDEQIKLFGSDVKYIPRIMVQDSVMNDVTLSKFTTIYTVEMLLQNVEGFGGVGAELATKFGLRVTDEATFIVSVNRWSEVDTANPALPDRPNEGDIIHYPLTGDNYEIKFVEKEMPFFQLGKVYFYTITTELMERGNTVFDTGDAAVDQLEREAYTFPITLINVTGTFAEGEDFTSSGGGTGTVVSFDAATGKLVVVYPTGGFQEGETVTGPNGTGEIQSFTTIQVESVQYDDNAVIEFKADDVIDFSERNPFGEIGNKTGSF
tara:strand:+ start:49108 stop:49971 length:864 start_codon:yes stop_codon:yes gene_type:complete